MPEYLVPGVYVEEVSFRPKSIEGVSTSTTAFVGPTRKGPLPQSGSPEVMTSFGEFARIYGGLADLEFAPAGNPPATNYLAHAVRNFFDNGGSRLYIGRTFTAAAAPPGRRADGVAQSTNPIVDDGTNQVHFRARTPGSGMNGSIVAREKQTPAGSRRPLDQAPQGSIVRMGASGTPAQLTGGVGPFVVAEGADLELVVSGTARTVTFSEATPARITGNAITFPIPNIPAGSVLTVTIGGGDPQDIPLPAGNGIDIATLVNALNNDLTGIVEGNAHVNPANELVIASDALGSNVSITVAANPLLELAGDTQPGGGNVADLNDVTVAELDALLQPIGVSATRNPITRELTLSTIALGNTATLQATPASAGAEALGLTDPGQPSALAPGSGDAGVAPSYYLKSGNQWDLVNGPGGNPLDLTGDLSQARLITMNLEAVDGDGNITLYEDLGFDPSHPRYVGAVLPKTPTRRADELYNPYYLDVPDGTIMTPFDLLTGVGPTEGGHRIDISGGHDGSMPGFSSYEDALRDMEDVGNVSIVAGPGHTAYDDFVTIADRLINHAVRMKYRIAVLDTKPGLLPGDVRNYRGAMDSTYAALYYPWVIVANPLARPGNDRIPKEIALPPSGFVTGIYARSDVARGVWKAPANEVVRGALRFEREINHAQQAVLNPEGVNCLRFFFGRGNRVWGARTISSDPEWKYVNIRRYFIYLEHSIDRSTQWAVFEPNGERLWANIRETVSAFLYNEWRSGALLGGTPEVAYFVRCDRSTMTQNDLDNGRLICEIGVAPLAPAEFVIFRIGQKTADARE